jgi:ABC-type antimicrobial peptide transport system permease subunit
VGATRHLGFDEAPRAEIYRPLAQDPDRSTLLVAARTIGTPMQLADELRRTVADLDPALPVEEVKAMDAMVGGRVAERRFYMTLLLLFATLAVALAATGIYGVMSYVVSQGRREIGIRLALGARPNQVQATIVRRGLAVVSLGAAAGFVGARVLSRFVEPELFEIARTDGLTYAAAGVCLLVIAATACWIPTRRAGRSPLEALRE